MNLQNVSIPIEPRSLGGCLDIATQFYRVHFREVLVLTLLVALPSCALTYLLATLGNNGLLWGLLIYFFAAPVAGALIVAGAGHRVFGDPFTVAGALGAFRPRAVGLTFSILWSRVLTLLSTLGVVACFLVAVRGGFLPEIVLLERLSGKRRRQRVAELTRGIQTSPVMSYVTILVFVWIVTVSLFTMIDLASNHLLGLYIWTGHNDGFMALLDRLWYDPVTVTALVAVLWLVYPVGRLAWFFCYLDQRIRNECWDVELDFRRDARRLTS